MTRAKKGDFVVIERGDPTRVTWDCLCVIGRMFTVTTADHNEVYPDLVWWRVPRGWQCVHRSLISSVWDEVCKPIKPDPTKIDIDVGEPEVHTI